MRIFSSAPTYLLSRHRHRNWTEVVGQVPISHRCLHVRSACASLLHSTLLPRMRPIALRRRQPWLTNSASGRSPQTRKSREQPHAPGCGVGSFFTHTPTVAPPPSYTPRYNRIRYGCSSRQSCEYAEDDPSSWRHLDHLIGRGRRGQFVSRGRGIPALTPARPTRLVSI
jgi:hypothetical protein